MSYQCCQATEFINQKGAHFGRDRFDDIDEFEAFITRLLDFGLEPKQLMVESEVETPTEGHTLYLMEIGDAVTHEQLVELFKAAPTYVERYGPGSLMLVWS